MKKSILLLSVSAGLVFGQSYSIQTIAGRQSLVGLPASVPGLAYSQGVAVDSSGNVYVTSAETGSPRVFEISPGGTILNQIGTGYGGFGGDGGPANEAYLGYPTAVAVDSTGNIYIADAGNYRIRRVDAGTGVITTIAGRLTKQTGGNWL